MFSSSRTLACINPLIFLSSLSRLFFSHKHKIHDFVGFLNRSTTNYVFKHYTRTLMMFLRCFDFFPWPFSQTIHIRYEGVIFQTSISSIVTQPTKRNSLFHKPHQHQHNNKESFVKSQLFYWNVRLYVF